MKKILKYALSVTLIFVFVLGLASCKDKAESPEGLWANAKYTEDAEFGNGSKTIDVIVEVEGKSVKFTVKTDKDNVGAALVEHGLIDGEDGPYGMYIKSVNGMFVDPDAGDSYWGVYIGDEAAMTGIDGVEVTDGATYRLVYTEM